MHINRSAEHSAPVLTNDARVQEKLTARLHVDGAAARQSPIVSSPRDDKRAQREIAADQKELITKPAVERTNTGARIGPIVPVILFLLTSSEVFLNKLGCAAAPRYLQGGEGGGVSKVGL